MKVLVKDLVANIMGVYKITFPNGKIYIGISCDIKRRMYEHNSLSQNKTVCDKAINKYGKIEEIEILEISRSYQELEEREKYWIKTFNSDNRDIGYNLTPGGLTGSLLGEDNSVSVFSNEQVLDIRKRRFLGERKKDVYLSYQDYAFSTFERVWLGHGYSNVGLEYIIPTHSKSRQEYSAEANSGVKNGRAKFSKEQVQNIRKRYENGETYSSILKDYNVSLNTIKRICNYETYKNI